ncbi:MAG TPA: hypothetical protein VMR33_16160 [Candidatus Baltobacteraceae bacterium]|jgi:hypothetical protein|nr:hypothetical protein [Candidatus Baltobacteraceae bacterium]
MEDFDIIGPTDHPALLAITTPEVAAHVRSTLTDMGYKVHLVDRPLLFETRYNQINYQIVFIEETFAGSDPLQNAALTFIQNLPMSQRRHATIFLIGAGYETLNTMQAFALSVHCVINVTELPMLTELVQKTVSENDLFLGAFREAQRRVYQKPS